MIKITVEFIKFLKEKAKEIKQDLDNAKKLLDLSRSMGFDTTELETRYMELKAQYERIEKALKSV